MLYLLIMDIIGTISFSVSGALVGIRKHLDIFGVSMLAVITATGGGFIRDLTIGAIPPVLFRNPIYVLISVLTAFVVFFAAKHLDLDHANERVRVMYDRILFWSDTLGLAAFSVDGVIAGVRAGFGTNLFLMAFLGFTTGTGGGILRDVLAGETPYVFKKHIYALAAIAGSLLTAVLINLPSMDRLATYLGFSLVIVIRTLAAHYKWNLPS